MGKPIRVVVVDDHPLYRSGVVATLNEFGDIEIAGQGATADEAVEMVRRLAPDIALLDISMPGSGLNAAAAIRASGATARVIMLTVSEDEDEVLKAIEAGAAGYALKGVGGEELVSIVRSVAAGAAYVAPTLAGRLLVASRAQRESPTAQGFATLSARELDVARLLTDGLSNKEIANALGLQEKTVKHHMTQVLQKLRVRNRVEAAMLARKYLDRRLS